MNTTNIVYCQKYGKEMPGLSQAPLKSAIGNIILLNVSADAWQEWVEAQIKVINEERLDLSEVSAQKRLFDRMIEFLGLSDFVDHSS